MRLTKIKKEEVNCQTGEMTITFEEPIEEGISRNCTQPEFRRLYLHFQRNYTNKGVSVSVRVVFDDTAAGEFFFKNKSDINTLLVHDDMLYILAERQALLNFDIIEDKIPFSGLCSLVSIHISTNWLLLLPD